MNEKEQVLYMQARLTRIASEKWGKSMADVIRLYSQYGVLEYIEGCYEIFHVQGDEANFDDIENYLRSRGVAIC